MPIKHLQLSKQHGRKKMHYLAGLGQALLQGSLNTITEAYVMFLMEKLEDGCLNPEIKEKTPERVTIRIDCPERGKDCFITINLVEWQFETLPDSPEDSIEQVEADEKSI